MHVKGTLFIVPRPEEGPEGAYQYVIHNQGDAVLTATHNIQPARGLGEIDSDDYETFGHGMKVPPSKVSEQLFPVGHLYKEQTRIEPGKIFRVGARELFWQEVVLPPMDTNEVVKLEFDSAARSQDDVNWTPGTDRLDPETLEGTANHAEKWKKPGMNEATPQGGVLLCEIDALTQSAIGAPEVKGTASIIAVKGGNREITHWEVKFSNEGAAEDGFSPFIGTVSFAGVGSKNAGLGLEGMACPEVNARAVQRIEAGGDYGVLAKPGALVRLGVRGLSSLEVPLPADGMVEFPLSSFTPGFTASQPDFFDVGAVRNKRAEKLSSGKVQFYDGDAPINGQLQPVTYRGSEAVAESDFPVPHVTVRRVRTPAGPGGWEVIVANQMAANYPDDFPRNYPEDFPDPALRGQPMAGAPIGFVADVGLGSSCSFYDPKAFRQPGEVRRWFIPYEAMAHGSGRRERAIPQARLKVTIQGMGLTVELPLPGTGEVGASPSQPEAYQLRPDKVVSSQLTHASFAKLRDSLDPAPKELA